VPNFALVNQQHCIAKGGWRKSYLTFIEIDVHFILPNKVEKRFNIYLMFSCDRILSIALRQLKDCAMIVHKTVC